MVGGAVALHGRTQHLDLGRHKRAGSFEHRADERRVRHRRQVRAVLLDRCHRQHAHAARGRARRAPPASALPTGARSMGGQRVLRTASGLFVLAPSRSKCEHAPKASFEPRSRQRNRRPAALDANRHHDHTHRRERAARTSTTRVLEPAATVARGSVVEFETGGRPRGGSPTAPPARGSCFRRRRSGGATRSPARSRSRASAWATPSPSRCSRSGAERRGGPERTRT